MTDRSTLRLRIFTAPGESPDLMETLNTEAVMEEVASFDQVDAHDEAAVLYLSRGLLKGLNEDEWQRLPPHSPVIASDSQARGEADKVGRLFLSMEDFTGDGNGLRRAVRAALRHSAALLGQQRARTAEARVHSTLEKLNKVGMALMSERDPDVLLGMILTQARASAVRALC